MLIDVSRFKVKFVYYNTTTKIPQGGGGKLFWYTSHSKRQHEVIFERLVDLRRDIIDREKWAHSHKILHVEYNSDQPTITREVQSHFNLKSTTWSGKHLYKYWKICEICPSEKSWKVESKYQLCFFLVCQAMPTETTHFYKVASLRGMWAIQFWHIW